LYVLAIATFTFPFTGIVVARMRDDLLRGQYTLVQTQPLELMMLELKLSFIIGILAALPIVFFFGYRYLKMVKLGERFKINTLKLAIAGSIGVALFILGCAYSYFLMLPLVFTYLLQSATDAGVANNWRVSEFINFALLTTLVFGIVFELPLIMTVLARSGIVIRQSLAKMKGIFQAAETPNPPVERQSVEWIRSVVAP
jgi:sec-independent protein translocase protein TatC